MIIYYRMTDIPSTNPSPILQDNKFELNKYCLESFINSDIPPNSKIVFLCDFCPANYDKMITDAVGNEAEVEIIHMELGINETCLKQYELAVNQDQETILFQECDYKYRPRTMYKMLDGINELGLVSPYDNLNFYLDPSIHSTDIKIRLVEDQHWRSVERVTMTFGLTKTILTDHLDVFNKYGYLDNDVWHQLRAWGHQMWTPLPSIATHMVNDFIAPGVEWKL